MLVLADLGSFGIMRALLRSVMDDELLGPSVAVRLGEILPRGLLNGWQYAFALFLALLVTGTYGAGDKRRRTDRLFIAAALATALPLWGTIWTRGLELVGVQYVLTTLLVWTGLVVDRLTVDRVVALFSGSEQHASATLFVGKAAECRDAMASSAFRTGSEFRSVGFLDLASPAAPDALGGLDEIATRLAETRADAVVICGFLPDERFQDVVDLALAAGCQVISVPRAIEVAWVQPTLVWRQGRPLIELARPLLKGWQVMLKRAVDVVGALGGLVALSPVIAAVAAAVRFDSPGPVLFAQERVGKGGRRFRILKFRTMVSNAEGLRADLAGQSVYGDQRLFKMLSDPRVTRVGRFLRRTSLDELPQLWNVLVGHMSLVGPRPPLPSEVELYEERHFARFDVKPGITGPWQVNGRNAITDFEEVIALESAYIREWSLWLDLVLLLRTVPAVLRMKGAY